MVKSTPLIKFIDEKVSLFPQWKFLVAVIVVYYVLSLSLLLSWPLPWPDEVHFGDVARTFADEQRLGTNLIKGMEERMYWQPPIYFLVLSAVIKFGGFNLVVLRLFSLVIGSLILVLVYRLGVKLIKDPLPVKIGVVLLALNPNFVTYVKLARMDGLCMVWTLLALVLYSSAMTEHKNIKFLVVGLFVSLAILTHPLGFIGLTAIVLHLFIFKRNRIVEVFRYLLILFIPVIIGLCFWGLYVLQDPQNFLMQMQYQFAQRSFSPPSSVVNFFERYRSIPFFLMVFIPALVTLTRKFIKSMRSDVGLLIILCYVSLLIVALEFKLTYHIYFLPYASLLIALFLVEKIRTFEPSSTLFAVSALMVLMVNFLLYFFYLNVVYHYSQVEETDYDKFVPAIVEALPAGSTVMLYGYPSVFWGLRESGKEFSVVESIFFNRENALASVQEIDCIVVTRAFDPVQDSLDMSGFISQVRDLLAESGARVVLVHEIGMKKRYSYSAEIYSVER